jgi:glutaredoxin
MDPATRVTAAALVAALWVWALACTPERPPVPEHKAPAVARGSTATKEPVYLEVGTSRAVISYAGERGAFSDTSDPDAVPERARGLVRVALLDGPKPGPTEVWVTNLREPEAEKRFRLRAVPRDLFEELALGEGLSSAVELPDGLAPPAQIPGSDDIVVYTTSWCGVCKKLVAYLERKGVSYVEKDIEKDREAAAELLAKAKKAGVEPGSVPVIDVRGELLVGFQRDRLEKLL